MSGLVRLLVSVVALGVGAGIVALPGGCSRQNAQEPATVRGAVTFQGQPLAGGLIVFSPDPDRGSCGKPIRGAIGPDGRFELRLGSEAAIPAGWYRVAIAPTPTLLPPTDATALLGPIFPPQLARPDMAGLLREVKPGRENVFDFAVEVPVG